MTPLPQFHRPRDPSLRLAPIALLLAAALGGCHQKEVQYVLTTVDRSPMPAVLQVDKGCLIQLMGGFVDIKGGTFSMSYNMRKVCPTGSTPLPNPGTTGRVKLGDVFVEFRANDGAIMDRGEMKGDTMVIENGKHVLRLVKKKQ